MRALSLPQPLAQLLAFGCKRFDVRAVRTDYRGRVVIHASSAAPRQSLLARCKYDKRFERALGNEGWLSYAALTRLPRSAFVGVAELVGVDRLKDFAARNPRASLLTTVDPEPRDFVWTFEGALAIDPVTGVPGRVGLWEVPSEHDASMGERVAQARAAGPRVENRAAQEAQTTREFERFLGEKEAEYNQPQTLFRSSDFEELFRRTLERYYAAHPLVARGKHTEVVRIVGRLTEIFPGRTYVPRKEFEPALREHLVEWADAPTRSLRGRPDEGKWGPEAEPVRYERWHGGSTTAGE